MKKYLLVAVIFCLAAAVVFAASLNLGRNINKQYSDCSKNCSQEKNAAFVACKETSVLSASQCVATKNSCINASSQITNETEAREAKRNCSRNFTVCKRQVNSDRVSCLKDAISEFSLCKKNCSEERTNCINLYQPVCGIDNKTYPNECVLALANVTKNFDGVCNITSMTSCALDSDCPEIVCVKGPCNQQKCINSTCVLTNKKK